MTSLKDGDLQTPVPLDTFMLQLGLVMRLPPKAAERDATPAPVARTRGRSTRIWLPVAAVGSALLLLGAQLRPSRPGALPREVVGTWETTDTRYAGRQLVLSDGMVLQASSAGGIGTPERIVSLSVRPRGDTMAVSLTHGTGADTATLSFAYVGGAEESITLRNPAGVRWTRVRADSTEKERARRQRLTPPRVAPGKKPWEH